MANAAEYRKVFVPEERATNRMKDLVDYIKGSSSLCLAEILGDMDFSELDDLESAARDAVKETPQSVTLRQVWLYFACLRRDMKYGYRGNSWLKQVGLNSLLRENYGGAKIAVDSGVSDE